MTLLDHTPHRLGRFFARTRGVAFLSFAILAVVACATSGEEPKRPAEPPSVVPLADAGEDGASDAATDADIPCTSEKLCPTPIPLPYGSVTALAGRSSDDVWASGTNGMLMHWDGGQWTVLDVEMDHTISSLFLTADETWGVAGDLVLRASLEPRTVQTTRHMQRVPLQGVAVLPSGNVYVALGSIFRSNQNVLARLSFDTGKLTYVPNPVLPWSDQPQSTLIRAAFLVPDEALWLVGDHGAVARYPISDLENDGDGGAARGVLMPVSSRTVLLGAWGQGEQLWAVGSQGTVLHFDGTEWHAEDTGTTATLHAIFGLSPTNIWAAGEDGTVLHFDGHAWSHIDVGSYRGTLKAIWASPEDLWIGGEHILFHRSLHP